MRSFERHSLGDWEKWNAPKSVDVHVRERTPWAIKAWKRDIFFCCCYCFFRNIERERERRFGEIYLRERECTVEFCEFQFREREREMSPKAVLGIVYGLRMRRQESLCDCGAYLNTLVTFSFLFFFWIYIYFCTKEKILLRLLLFFSIRWLRLVYYGGVMLWMNALGCITSCDNSSYG